MGHKGEQLFVLGSTHRSAPIEVRERFAVGGERLGELYRGLQELPGLEEALVLNTCNRVELYGVGPGDDDELRGRLIRFFADFHRAGPEEFARHSFWLRGRGAVDHLFAVSAGLDSQIVGETEIFGQVKDAYGEAAGRGTAGALLHRVFQKSFQAAKWVRHHTGISRGQTNVSNVAVELAGRIFGDLGRSRTLVVGTGEVGGKTAVALRSRGAREIAVASRTPANAEALAAGVGGAAVPFEGCTELLGRFDIVICSTSAPDYVIDRPAAAAAIHRRPQKPLFLIDLAVPRDVEAAVGDLPNVFLYNLDDLAAIANENLRGREREIERCREALRERAERLWAGVARR